MDTVNTLNEKRLNLWNQMQDLLKRAKNEKRSLADDETIQFRKMDSDLTALKAQIDTEVRAQELENEFSTTDPNVKIKRAAPDADPQKAYALSFGKLLRHGKDTSAEDMKIIKEYRGTSTQVVGTDSLGGYLVHDLWSKDIDSTTKEYGGMLNIGNVFKTESGGDFHIPLDDNRATVGALIAENTASTVSDETLGEAIMKAFVVESKWIKASYEMLNDTAYDLEGYIKERIGERIGRKLNAFFTTGAGTTEPFGVVTQSTLGKTTAGVAAVTRAEVLGLIHSVDPSYRKSKSTYIMTNDATILALKLLTVGSGDDRPLWQPSIIGGEPDRLEGYKVMVNQDMASMATGVKFMLFGDFSKYWIRQVWDIKMQISAEKYIDSRAMAYNGYCRYDGLLVNTAAVKHMKNA